MWTDVKLGQLFDIGSSKRVLKSQWQNAGVPFYRGREVTRLARDGFVDNELFISEELFKEFSAKYGVPKSGDIVITAIGTIGNSYIVREDDRFYFKDASVLWLKKLKEVSSEFINYWLKSSLMKRQLDEGNGATVDTLTIRKLHTLRLMLPPISEQKRIVAILDEAFTGIDAAISNTEKNLGNARELFESYLTQAFSDHGWPKKYLSEVAENLDRKRVPITKAKRKSGNIPYYGASGVVDHVVDYLFNEDLLLVSEDGANLLARTYPIAFSISGKSWVNNHAHVLKFSNIESQKFVENYLNSISLSRYVSGMAQPKLNQKALNSIPVPFPSLTVQKEVVGKLEDISASTSRLLTVGARKLEALRELKHSLLHKAFSGELTDDFVEQEVDEAVA